jgi:hypothetical protein
MSCIASAITLGPFDRYVLISGQDYPIASNAAIAEFFSRNRRTEYVEALFQDLTDEAAPGWTPYYRFRRYHVWLGNQRRALPLLRKGLPPLPIYHGSTWWALTHEAVSYLLNQYRANYAFNRYFHHSFLVEEAYIQTLMRASAFVDHIANRDVTYAKWTPTSGPHPKILRSDDIGGLLASGKLFARKVDATVDEGLLDQLDEHNGSPKWHLNTPVLPLTDTLEPVSAG